jgi:hypothetical protein
MDCHPAYLLRRVAIGYLLIVPIVREDQVEVAPGFDTCAGRWLGSRSAIDLFLLPEP